MVKKLSLENIQQAKFEGDRELGGGSEEARRYSEEHTPPEARLYREMNVKQFQAQLNEAVNERKCDIKDSEILTDMMKKKAMELGADLVGKTRLNKIYTYLGQEVEGEFAISLAIEMRWENVKNAPSPQANIEGARVYYELGKATIGLASFIRNLGYPAYPHIPLGPRRVLQIPVAIFSGLALLGRNGIGLTKEFGPRVRLSCVTTDLPLLMDKPPAHYSDPFCDSCRICWKACPAGAIAKELKEERGLERYITDYVKCRTYRQFNYSCGLCFTMCPPTKLGIKGDSAIFTLTKER